MARSPLALIILSHDRFNNFLPYCPFMLFLSFYAGFDFLLHSVHLSLASLRCPVSFFFGEAPLFVLARVQFAWPFLRNASGRSVHPMKNFPFLRFRECPVLGSRPCCCLFHIHFSSYHMKFLHVGYNSARLCKLRPRVVLHSVEVIFSLYALSLVLLL